MTKCFSKNSHCDLDLRALYLELVQDIVILNICVKFNHNQSINKGARVVTIFSINSHCDLDLGPKILKFKTEGFF